MTIDTLEKETRLGTEIDFEEHDDLGFEKPVIEEDKEVQKRRTIEKSLKERIAEEAKINYGDIELIRGNEKLYEKTGIKFYKEKCEELKKDWKKEPIKEIYRADRKTVLSTLRGTNMIKLAYKELFGGGIRALWRKKEKMKMLEALLDSENLDEAMKTYWNYYKVKKSLLPGDKKIENYVKQYMKEEKRRENYSSESPEFNKAVRNVIYMARAA